MCCSRFPNPGTPPTRIMEPCAQCGEEMDIDDFFTYAYGGCFCSDSCLEQWAAENLVECSGCHVCVLPDAATRYEIGEDILCKAARYETSEYYLCEDCNDDPEALRKLLGMICLELKMEREARR